VTYRDDHDAALARADALADDLKRTEAERDRLREQVAQLEKVAPAPAPPPPRQPVALAPAPSKAMTTRELDELVETLLTAAKRIRSLNTARVVAAGLLILVALVMCFTSLLLPALLLMALGILAAITSILAEYGDHAPIIEAVRAHPQEVVEIRESVTTKGNRWITITTRDGTSARFLPVGATALVGALVRRCQDATLR
jgi:hypothetical protein